MQEESFGPVPPEIRYDYRPLRVPRFHRTLGGWMNLLVETGVALERLGGPYPDDEAVRERPGLQDA